MLQFYKGNIKWIGKLIYFGYLSPHGVRTEFGLTIPYHRLMFGNSNFHPLTQDFENVNNEATYKYVLSHKIVQTFRKFYKILGNSRLKKINQTF